MHVVIVEPFFIGHYLTYVRRVVEAMRGLADKVTVVLSPEGIASKEFDANLRPVLTNEVVETTARPPRGGMVRGTLDMISVIGNALKKVSKPDHLILPTADYFAQAVGLANLVGYSPFPKNLSSEGLLTNLGFTYPNSERKVPASLMKMALRKSEWTRLHTIDLLALQWMRNNEPRLAKRMQFMPDPVEEFQHYTKESAREILQLPKEGKIIVCPGILIYRKGIGVLLEAFLQARKAPDTRILLAGPVGNDVKQVLQDARFQELLQNNKLIVIDKYLNSVELGQVISAGDVTACPYPKQWHPSSIAVKSLACHRPVLGAETFWLGTMIPAFKMGWTGCVNDPKLFSGAMETALRELDSWKISDAARKLVSMQSIGRCTEAWKQELRIKSGQGKNEPNQDVEELLSDVGLDSYGTTKS